MSTSRYSGSTLYNVHIADGFADDCENLIHRCMKIEPLTYKRFCILWKNMDFASIYQGRTLGSEVAELSEEMIHIAKRYMVSKSSNFKESIAGLFLVYALINLQPFSGFAALRLVPEDMPAINRIEVAARMEKRYDVLYILGSVLVKGPCQFHVEQRERGMELPLRKYLEGVTAIDDKLVRPKGVFYKRNEELDTIKEMNTILQQYNHMKNKIESHKRDRSLRYTDHNIGITLGNSLKKLINGQINNAKETDDDSVTTDSSSSDQVHAIKLRAMANTVNPVKHLTGLHERQNQRVSPSTANINAEKNCSPTKSRTRTSPRKRRKRTSNVKGSIKSKRRRKPKNLMYSSSSDEDKPVGDEDLNLDCFPKLEEMSNANEEDPEFIENTEQPLNVEINSLPILIRTDNPEEFIEIEIIDQFETNQKEIGKPQCEKEEPDTKLTQKVLRLRDVSIERTTESIPYKEVPDEENATEMAKLSKITSKDDAVFKKPSEDYQTLKLRKPEKRDLKKTILKSKFKRMGMLPMANFKENK